MIANRGGEGGELEFYDELASKVAVRRCWFRVGPQSLWGPGQAETPWQPTCGAVITAECLASPTFDVREAA